jgi:putative membrane protein
MWRLILLRWFANSVGLWIAARLLPGIEYHDSLWVIIIAALLFSLVNALVRPFVVILSLPAIVLSLGLFTFIINSLMLYLVTVIYPRLVIDSFTAALLAVIIIWLVNYALSVVLHKDKE